MPTLEHRGYLLHWHHGRGETIREDAEGHVKIFATMRAAKLSITKLRTKENESLRCNGNNGKRSSVRIKKANAV
jgi:hypothetical protein